MKITTETQIQQAYDIAQEQYMAMGVDVGQALDRLGRISISLHCWQGDDVGGFEKTEAELADGVGGGLAVTGNYPGRARSADELRRDLDLVYSLIPGKHRLNLHAIYAETGGKKVERTDLRPEHFANWVEWARGKEHGLDFNPTCFAHPLAADGFTLSHRDASIRRFWIEHCIASRKIGEYFGRELGSAAITNIWIPDGYKDTPVDRSSPRRRLCEALDAVLSEKIDPRWNLDAVEPKLFGLGSESYVTGSMEFYTGYAIRRGILLTLDSGHFHPTESIADKISSLLLYLDRLQLHVSRGVRWDSDHVVTYDDDLQAIAQEVVRANALERVHIGLDYFDASINRLAAWTIGARSTLRALLSALLEPYDLLTDLEGGGDYTQRLALLEVLKTLPCGAVWDYHCLSREVPAGIDFMAEIRDYEREEMARRG